MSRSSEPNQSVEASFSQGIPAAAQTQSPAFRSGFVALVGRPNAGKSTLLNACMGEKIAITSPVAQTTRRRLRAVVNRDTCQLVIVDTPGIHKPKDGLGEQLNRSALAELDDVDVVAFLVDASAPFGRGDAWVAKHVAKSPAYKVLVLTKADLANADVLAAQRAAAHECLDFDDEIITSATEDFNVDGFVNVVVRYLPEGPRWFPSDMDTDESEEMRIAELVREKVLRHTSEEIPHAVGVICDSIERAGADLLRIHATIYVEREGQKGILIGRGGEMIKRLGADSRADIERMCASRVYLELAVKVKPHWRRYEREIRAFGYGDTD